MQFFADIVDHPKVVSLALSNGHRIYASSFEPGTNPEFIDAKSVIDWLAAGGYAQSNRLLLWHPRAHADVEIRITHEDFKPSVATKMGVSSRDRVEFESAVVLDLGAVTATHVHATLLAAVTEARATAFGRASRIHWPAMRSNLSRLQRAIRKSCVATLPGFGPALPAAFNRISHGLRTWDTIFAGQDKTAADLKAMSVP